MSISSILNVIEFIISRAVVQLGATQPLKIHTMLSTFSTNGCGGFTEDLSSTICALVSLRSDWSVILTAYWNSSSKQVTWEVIYHTCELNLELFFITRVVGIELETWKWLLDV